MNSLPEVLIEANRLLTEMTARVAKSMAEDHNPDLDEMLVQALDNRVKELSQLVYNDRAHRQKAEQAAKRASRLLQR